MFFQCFDGSLDTVVDAQLIEDATDVSLGSMDTDTKLIRDFRLFAVNDDAKESAMEVKAIHDEQGYKDVRRRLSRHYDVAAQDPDLQVTDADLSGSRRLVLTHRVRNGVLLDKTEAERTLQYLAQLWGYRVKLVEQDVEGGRVLKEHEALPMP